MMHSANCQHLLNYPYYFHVRWKHKPDDKFNRLCFFIIFVLCLMLSLSLLLGLLIILCYFQHTKFNRQHEKFAFNVVVSFFCHSQRLLFGKFICIGICLVSVAVLSQNILSRENKTETKIRNNRTILQLVNILGEKFQYVVRTYSVEWIYVKYQCALYPLIHSLIYYRRLLSIRSVTSSITHQIFAFQLLSN